MSKASIAQSSYVPCFHSASRSGVICSNSFCAKAAGGRPSASTNCTSQKSCSSSLALCSKPSTMTFTGPPATYDGNRTDRGGQHVSLASDRHGGNGHSDHHVVDTELRGGNPSARTSRYS